MNSALSIRTNTLIVAFLRNRTSVREPEGILSTVLSISLCDKSSPSATKVWLAPA